MRCQFHHRLSLWIIAVVATFSRSHSGTRTPIHLALITHRLSQYRLSTIQAPPFIYRQLFKTSAGVKTFEVKKRSQREGYGRTSVRTDFTRIEGVELRAATSNLPADHAIRPSLSNSHSTSYRARTHSRSIQKLPHSDTQHQK
jgi:hypothetical protein